MKIVTLMENTCTSSALVAEHGLSLYIETEGVKVLFDMGQSADFLSNAEALGVDLSAVDVAILSHGHYDHSGGLSAFLEVNNRAKIHITPFAFEGHYHGLERYIGVDQAFAENPRFTTKSGEISPNLRLYHNLNQLVCLIDDAGLYVMEDGVLVPEDYRHEHYLSIVEGNKTVLISGCSHRGILNIVSQFQPDVLIGGFHCSKWEAPRLEQLAKELSAFKTQYYTCHCTGMESYETLKKAMGNQVDYLSGGSALELFGNS